jgi:hypothetical protein
MGDKHPEIKLEYGLSLFDGTCLKDDWMKKFYDEDGTNYSRSCYINDQMVDDSLCHEE